VAAPLALQARSECWHWHVIGKRTYVRDAMMIAAAAEAPDGKGVHAVLAHVAEDHGRSDVQISGGQNYLSGTGRAVNLVL
jgi:hypothetical protein